MTGTWHTVRMRRLLGPALCTALLTIPAGRVTATTPTTEGDNPPTDAAPITSFDPLPVLLPFPGAGAVEPRVMLGSIEIPRLDIAKPLMEGVALTTLDIGPGHAPGSAVPGQLGNVVVGGHRTSRDHPFADLDQLVPGDEVIFRIDQQRFTYLVESTEVISPAQLRVVRQDRLYTATLFACHPTGSTRQRIIVHLRFAP